MKFVIDDKIPFLSGVFEPYGEVLYKSGSAICPGDLADADALIVRTRTKCDETLLGKSRVSFVGTATIGMDHIDLKYLENRKIAFASAPGCNANSVAQYFASVISHWFPYPKRAVIGIVGVGHVGSAVAKMAAILGHEVLLCDPPRKERGDLPEAVAFQDVLAHADVVTMHVPLTSEGRDPTRKMFSDDMLSFCRRGQYFINSSRGAVTEDSAVRKAMESGIFRAVALDVWNHEPEIDRTLLEQVDFATPHIAGYSLDGKANGSSMIVRAAAQALHLDELKDWRVAELPIPPSDVIDFRSVADCIHASYDVAADTQRLRNAPEQFEMQRGNYPLRREFGAYTVRNAPKESQMVLSRLGFHLGE
ncbi:MAG: 4-phosphoerythronate dehydrogenase [Victivallaceae bacterium]|nr:4-phosphoerythronate dehydrogenase [Victivallaceae bacterium]